MSPAVVTKIVQDAKYLFDHGAFTVLVQAEFFAALANELAAPPPSPAPPPPDNIREAMDAMSATASVGDSP